MMKRSLTLLTALVLAFGLASGESAALIDGEDEFGRELKRGGSSRSSSSRSYSSYSKSSYSGYSSNTVILGGGYYYRSYYNYNCNYDYTYDYNYIYEDSYNNCYNSGGSSAGGIIIGSIFFCICVGVCCHWCCKQCRKSKAHKTEKVTIVEQSVIEVNATKPKEPVVIHKPVGPPTGMPDHMP